LGRNTSQRQDETGPGELREQGGYVAGDRVPPDGRKGAVQHIGGLLGTDIVGEQPPKPGADGVEMMDRLVARIG
jgi:hypothetical protein